MQKSSKAEARFSLLLSLFVLGLIAAVIVVPYQFQSEASAQDGKKGLFIRTESHEEGLPNYDIRMDVKRPESADALVKFRNSVGKDASAIATTREDFARGEEALKSRVPSLKVEYNEDIRIPEVIAPDVWRDDVERLSPASSAKRSEVLRGFIKQNSSLVGVSSEQADSLRVVSDYTNPDGNLSFAQLNQEINGIPVFRGEIKAGFTKKGEMMRVINNLAPGLEYSSLSADFRDPVDAVRSAARNINYELKPVDTQRNDAASDDLKVVFGDGDWATTAEKMYFPTEPGVAVPAWRVLIWQPVNAYYVIVDAESGTMLWRKNITEDQTQSATYQVYRNTNGYINAADNPAPLSPGPINPTLGTQGALINRANVTLIGNEGANSFNNNGWINDGANITDGNNLEAGIDRDGSNGIDAPQTGSPNRVFDSTWNPPPGNPAPGDDPLTPQAQRGAVIQMFYVMNLYHDELYKRGFTEQAFNFQHDNFGRGGIGNDRVSAEGQDSSGTNNANFSTPADGGRGRMQMFLWTGPTPDYDGTGDAEVIIHEVTHGTSNRLHGNSSGLSTNMARGMGEGWGDFYGYTLLAEPSDPIDGVYTTGGYATYLAAAGFTSNYYHGIRRFPRAPITLLGPNGKPHAPFTFRHLNSNCNTEIGTPTTIGTISAYPRGPFGVSQCDAVHNAGEIWSSTLWEVRNRMVTRLGFTTGTRDVLQVVTDGMKLAPLGPTFLQERDAIIAAAQTISSAHANDVREGFRVRGMGFFAQIVSASPANVVESFDPANALIGTPITITDPSGNGNNVPEPGENILIHVPVVNNTGAPVNNVQVNINGGANVNYGTIADGQTVTHGLPFAVAANLPCGSTVTVQLNLTSSAGTNAPRPFSFVLGTPVGIIENFDGVTAPALPAGWTMTQDVGTGISWTTSTATPDSAPNHAFAPDPAAVNMASLVSPSIPITSTSAQVKFRNNYATENTFDGMVLEIKIGNGAWEDILAAGGSFVTGGYSGTLSTAWQNPLGGRQAWFGSSGGYINTVANLPAAANGQSIQLRWRMASDQSVSSTGVRVDNVEVVSSFNCGVTASSTDFDFDGDGKADIGIYRPSAGQWWYTRSSDAEARAFAFGLSTDTITPSDFTGDGKTDIAIFRQSSGFWYIMRSEDNTFYGFPFGANGDVAVPGDYDGDGKADPALFRGGTWFILQSSNGSTRIDALGTATDRPVNADYDGDGKDDIAVYRPNGANGGEWWLNMSTDGLRAVAFGASTDKAVPADYTGDGKVDVAVWRPSTGFWYILRSEDFSFYGFPFGANGDAPAAADYDGDGKADAALFRSGTWYINRSTAGQVVVPFGTAGDQPTPGAYVR